MVKYWKKPEVMEKKAEYIRDRYASDPKYRKYMKKFNEEYYEENKDIMIRRARQRNKKLGEDYTEYQKKYYERENACLSETLTKKEQREDSRIHEKIPCLKCKV